MKTYKPKHKVGDIVKWENEITCVHELILDIDKAFAMYTYTLLTLDSGEIDEDIDCEAYDTKSIRVA